MGCLWKKSLQSLHLNHWTTFLSKGKVFTLLLYTLQKKFTYPTLGKGKSSSKCHSGGDMLVSLEGIFISTKKMVSNWDVEYIDSIDEKNPFMTAQRGGICYASASSQGPPCDLEVQTALNPLVSWWFPKKMSTKLLHQILQSTNWTKKNRVKRSLFPVSLSGSPRCFCWCYPSWN